ncbi:MAG TPA: hypothetical protein VF427_09960 [Noviherbaspirillum sp.]
MDNHLVTTRSVSTRLQRLAARALALLGWHVKFEPLPGPRGVVIVYPHTSNWDVVLGLLAKWAVGIRFRWLAKNSLFRGLAGKTIGALLLAGLHTGRTRCNHWRHRPSGATAFIIWPSPPQYRSA